MGKIECLYLEEIINLLVIFQAGPGREWGSLCCVELWHPTARDSGRFQHFQKGTLFTSFNSLPYTSKDLNQFWKFWYLLCMDSARVVLRRKQSKSHFVCNLKISRKPTTLSQLTIYPSNNSSNTTLKSRQSHRNLLNSKWPPILFKHISLHLFTHVLIILIWQSIIRIHEKENHCTLVENAKQIYSK